MTEEELVENLDELCEELLEEKFTCLANELYFHFLYKVTKGNELAGKIESVYAKFFKQLDKLLYISRKYYNCAEKELSENEENMIMSRVNLIYDVAMELTFFNSAITKFLEMAIRSKCFIGIEDELNKIQYCAEYSKEEFNKDIDIIKKIS